MEEMQSRTPAPPLWYAVYAVDEGQVTYLYGGCTYPSGTTPEQAAGQGWAAVNAQAEPLVLSADDRACRFRRPGQTRSGQERVFEYLIIRFDDLVPRSLGGMPWVDGAVTALAQHYVGQR